jgi:hypothetical protein
MVNEQLRLEDIDSNLKRQELDSRITALVQHIDEKTEIHYLSIEHIETTDPSYWEELSRLTGMGIAILCVRARPGPQQDAWPTDTRANIYFLSSEELQDVPRSLEKRTEWLWMDYRFYDGVFYTGSDWLRVASDSMYGQQPKLTALDENSRILKPSEFWVSMNAHSL